MDTQELIIKIEQNIPVPYQEYKALVTPSETPCEFHPLVFLTMISAAIGDKVYFIEGTDKIYPNLWTLFVGESSISRKSSAIRPALLILGNMKSTRLFASRGSPEGLFDEIIEANGVGLLSHSELGALLGLLKKDYMRGLTETMCEIYDPVVPNSIAKRLAQEPTIKVEHLAISWIACTTQTSLSQHLTYSDDRIASGFLPRFNIVFGTNVRDLVPFRPSKDRIKQGALVKKLTDLNASLNNRPVEFVFSQESVDVFSRWYNIKRQEMLNGSIDEVTSYFWIRTFEVAKKYAVILAVLKGKPNVVDKESMEQAILIGEYFLATSQRLIQREISVSYDEGVMQRILKVIEDFPHKPKTPRYAEHRDILAYTHLTSSKLKPYLDTLLDREEIEEVIKDNKRAYKLKKG